MSSAVAILLAVVIAIIAADLVAVAWMLAGLRHEVRQLEARAAERAAQQ